MHALHPAPTALTERPGAIVGTSRRTRTNIPRETAPSKPSAPNEPERPTLRARWTLTAAGLRLRWTLEP